jgi:hypothetical protein
MMMMMMTAMTTDAVAPSDDSQHTEYLRIAISLEQT